jgi:hypothetical protein
VDAWQAGSRWSGQAYWLPNRVKGPRITVAIHERIGDDFTGTYTAVEEDGRRFEWRIAGTVRQEWRIAAKVPQYLIQWRFTEVIEQAHPTNVVKSARVEGKQIGETLELYYYDDESSAQLDLRQEE